jgi:hypothetical protein
MAYAAVRVADVNLYVGSALADLGLSRFFESASGRPEVTLEVLCSPAPSSAREVCPLQQAHGLHIVIHDIERDLFDILRCVAYLAGLVSERYAYFHAAGLVVDGKGILLIGRSGNGKSTLAGLLEGKVIDDDMLLVSDTEMVRVSRYGAQIQPDGRTVRLTETEPARARVDYIFVLDRQADPSRVRRLQPEDISPEDTFDDALHPGLFSRYAGKRVCPNVPAYRIGTRRAPGETRKTIENILRGVQAE